MKTSVYDRFARFEAAEKKRGSGMLMAALRLVVAEQMARWRSTPRHSKYGNRPTRCDQGVMHQSAAESRRCDELHLLQQGGKIRDLEAHPQPRIRCEIDGRHICDYLPDFRYYDIELDREVVEDVKGSRTEVYKLKRRIVYAIHGIEIEEVRAR